MLTLSDLGIILARLFLETLSYYNAKFMYALKGTYKISPVLTLYLTHSMGSLILIGDIIKHKLKYPLLVEKETGVKFKPFFLYVCFLSLFYNLCHIPKFYAMNYMSDVTIVSIYSASVLFTYIFSVIVISKKVVPSEACWVVFGLLGIIIMGNGAKINAMWVSIVISSVFSGLYGVLFKVFLNDGKSREINIEEKLISNSVSEATAAGIIDRDKKIEYDNSMIITESELTSKAETTELEPIAKSIDTDTDEKYIHKANVPFINLENKLNEELEAEPKQTHSFIGNEISSETNRRIMFMKHYISLTGLVTFLFYWPGLWLANHTKIEIIKFPFRARPIIHILIANIVSLSHNLMYFIIVAARTPLFAQISGIILQPTFLFISILQKHGIACMGELIGCLMSFFSFLFLCRSNA